LDARRRPRVRRPGRRARRSRHAPGDPASAFDQLTFASTRNGDALAGSASFKAKAGVAGTTAWTLHSADGGNLEGATEVVLVDPDTGEAAEFLGHRTEKQTFAVARPVPAAAQARPSPSPEAPKPSRRRLPRLPSPSRRRSEAPKPERTARAQRPVAGLPDRRAGNPVQIDLKDGTSWRIATDLSEERKRRSPPLRSRSSPTPTS